MIMRIPKRENSPRRTTGLLLSLLRWTVWSKKALQVIIEAGFGVISIGIF